MSRHKPPPSKAMADALRAAVGKMKEEDREASQESASQDTPSSSGGIDFAAAVEAAGHVRRLKHKQPSGLTRSRRKRVRTEPLKKKPPRRRRSVDKTPQWLRFLVLTNQRRRLKTRLVVHLNRQK